MDLEKTGVQSSSPTMELFSDFTSAVDFTRVYEDMTDRISDITTTLTSQSTLITSKVDVLPDYDTIIDIYFFGMAVVIPVGLLCNLFSFSVFMTSPTLRRTTTGHFLIALTVADFMFLTGDLLRWMNSEPASFDLDMPNFLSKNKIACWITYYLRYAAKLVSAWVTVAITTERFITITFPLKVAQISTPFRAKIVITVITIIGLILGAYPFWTLDVKEYKGNMYCLISDAQVYETWSMVVLRFGTLLIPSLIIIILTILIIYNLTKAGSKRHSQLEGQKKPSAKAMVERQLTIMLLAVAISFILLRLPYTIAFYIYHHKNALWPPKPGPWLTYRIGVAYRITDIFATLNYCLNFFLYCVCGSVFRNRIRTILHCQKSSQNYQTSLNRTRSSVMSSGDSRSIAMVTNGVVSNGNHGQKHMT